MAVFLLANLPDADALFRCKVHTVAFVHIEGSVEVIQVLWLHVSPKFVWGVNVNFEQKLLAFAG